MIISAITYTPALGECGICDVCDTLVPVSYCDDCGEASCDYCLSAYGCDCE